MTDPRVVEIGRLFRELVDEAVADVNPYASAALLQSLAGVGLVPVMVARDAVLRRSLCGARESR